jgi:hypothetical protein
MTAQTIITQALIDMGIYFPGETPAASESSNGLTKLNIMLDSWSGARDLIYEIGLALYALSNAQTFPIGPTATSPFNVARPIKIETATIVITIGGKLLRFPLQIIREEEWTAISDLGATGTVPSKLYYDPSEPNAALNFHPIPLASATTQVELGTWTAVQQFALLSTNATLPPAYYKAILIGLQLELAPTYGNLVSAQILELRAQQLKEALAIVRDLNSKVQMVQLQPVSTGQPQQPQQGNNPNQLAAIQAALAARGQQ